MSHYVLNEVRKGFYLDSVELMRLSREVAAMDGVVDAALMMGSPANLAILREAGLLDARTTAARNDLVVALRASSTASAQQALKRAIEALEPPRGAAPANAQAGRPRSIAAALRAMPEANLALISVPGDFAAAEARKALRRGLNVLMFSDNVALEDEVSLKREARDLGLLLMGPDCGTAIINGVPLAFANCLRRGAVGIIGASGTGIQEVSCLISEAGGGISHAIGVGGRDLAREVGAITTLMAMDTLDEDAGTESVVLISKPLHAEVAHAVAQRIARSAKPYTVCFIGADAPELPPNARPAATLRETAELALGGTAIGADFDVPAAAAAAHRGTRPGGRIEGLFSGGTLCAEAQVVLRAGARRIASNAAIPRVAALDDARTGNVDRLIDLGADSFTRGRPHPMIDPAVRDMPLHAALRDPQVAVVLLDFIIGYGAHVDPAALVADVVAGAPEDRPAVVASVTGTSLDPQDRKTQIQRLRDAGIIVAPSNAHAAELALALCGA